MLDLAAFEAPIHQPIEVDPFGAARVKRAPELLDPSEVPELQGATRDQDGIIIPAWHAATEQGRKNWSNLPLPLRKRRSEEYVGKCCEKPKAPKARRPGATRFTTDYAVDHGKKVKKWKLIEREGYDFRTKRHHDLELGSDALFDDGIFGRIAVQGAGVGERAEHWQRFVDRGGVEKATRRGLQFFYWEFIRGQKTPVKEERWA